MDDYNNVTKKMFNPAYNKAFIDYLRWGTNITVPQYIIITKSWELEKFYIWRIMQDFRVRPKHTSVNGVVLAGMILVLTAIQAKHLIVDVKLKQLVQLFL